MSARYTKHQTEACRAKIKTTQLVNRLMRHINGKLELSATQVRSIECLLNKTLPNLQQAEHTVDVKTYVARLPEPAPDAAAWLATVDKPLLVSTPLASDTQPIDIVDMPPVQEPEGTDKQGGE
jgi:hypothetical protein